MRLKSFSIKAIILLFLCCTAQARIAQVQQITGSSACSSSTTTTCAVTVAATGSGHILIAVFDLQSAGSSVSAVSGGGSWIHAPNCAAGAGSLGVDCWYVLNSTPGAKAITATVTSGSARGVEFYEFSIGAGCSAAYDSSNSSGDNTAASNQPGVPMALTGLNDVVVQGIYAGAMMSSINGGYLLSAGGGTTNRDTALLLNTVSSTAPVWAITSSQVAAVNAIAISESCPVTSVTVSPVQVSMAASQVQQFVATETGSGNPVVNWSINPPIGSISSSGVYTAPGSISSAQTVTVMATSAANPSFSASATVSLGAARITQVQQVTGGAGCSSSTLKSCTATVAPTGSGDILIAVFELQSSGSAVSAVSGGGAWVHAPNCAASTDSLDVDCWYVLNSTPGAAAITATVTAGSARGVEFYEFSVGAGCFAAYDSSGSSGNNPASGQPGIALTLTGFNDVIVQGIAAGATVSSINGGYALSTAGASNRYAALLLNTVSGTAPMWTLSSNRAAALNAIAISETCPVSSVTVSPTQMTMSASQMQQFVATETGSSNTAINWSVNPAVGSISSSGVYTAPAMIASAQTVTVTATSAANSVFSASATVSLVGSSTLATFPLNELFGVAWTDQPIEFRYDGGQPPAATTRMLGPLGTEVPYQWVTSCSDTTAVKGCIAVRGNLPANANYTWTLQSGTAPTATVVNPVKLNQVGNNYEITNGLTGVRIVTAAANPAPFSLAPIQGIWLPGGTWTGVGATPNLLYSEADAGCIGCGLQTPIYSATGYTVTVVDSGPLKAVLKVNYSFNLGSSRVDLQACKLEYSIVSPK